MIRAHGYAAQNAKSPLVPFTFERRDPGDHDVVIEILYCGICHSDIHQVRNEWGNSTYPMVPGHEIVGRVSARGKGVTKFREGDLVGVGCFVDSCRECGSCKEGEEQFCTGGATFTYNGTERDGKTPTFGGYSSVLVTNEDYVLRVPEGLDLAAVAPLLCAGITTYSPLRRWKASQGQRVGVVGLGGLGHMGVKFAASFGCEVTVISTSARKEADARRLGASHFLVSTDPSAMAKAMGSFDFILDTVSASHDINALLGLLRRDGTLVLVGAPDKPLEIAAMGLIFGRKTIAGSLIGGIRETQEMLDYCGEKGIVSDVEVIPMQQVDAAYDRTVKGDVRYRFSIDMKSLST
ncbi:NAD(P)-dependent alcohol dehydrogenase [Polyangium spumosum]|uniref:Alcohol dehydrogenase catalytic domain-containing protein n=1 Tax=Polyangium spumosum TaxID=889282 RepID=A0A6N7PV69_9BACT|nr:NAD(P)-dependent alcohol dehydrogenase [Polyangium spumosum]MRG94330.1 alcohol dehydrogenase catalytic domain-containing protein [Polyangium spumosum]